MGMLKRRTGGNPPVEEKIFKEVLKELALVEKMIKPMKQIVVLCNLARLHRNCEICQMIG